MTISTEMTCRELVELVTEYLEGTLKPEERRRFEEHIADCPGCTVYLEQMRQTIQMLGRLTEASLPGGAGERLLDLFRDWKRGQATSPR